MASYTTLQRNIAKLAAIALLTFISPLSAVNAATGNINVVTEVSTPTNDTTPNYTFNSDSTWSIAYSGPCSSVLTTLVSTGNTTITLNSLPEWIYSTCTIQVDNGEGPSNLLTLATFIVDITAPVVTLSGSSPMTIFSGSTYTDSGATWSDAVDGTGNILVGIYGNTGSFQSTGSVNTSQTWSYSITYLKVDAAWNTGSVTRTVNVVGSLPDTTAPSVTINTKSGQLDPTTTSPVLYTAVFSEPIDVSSFRKFSLSTSGSTASGIVINSITEVAPNNGTTFDISVSASGTGKIVLSIPQWTAPISSILGTTGDRPVGIIVDAGGNIYTSNTTGNSVSKITREGVSSILGTTGARPNSIIIDNSGSIYTANASSNNVTKITASGVSSILGTTGNGPEDIMIDVMGNIYTANLNSNNITKITPTWVSTIFGTTGDGPYDITTDAIGNIYTANYYSGNITKITPTWVSTIFGTIGTRPYWITIDSIGNIYTANYYSGSIIKITASGALIVIGTTGNGPLDITIDSIGNIYTANAFSNNVTKITPTWVSTIFGTTGDSPYSIAVDALGNIYTANANSNNVTKITPPWITDLAGNYNIASTSTDNDVTISTPDITRPIVTLVGSGTQVVHSGSIYTDLGASWTDNIDGSGNTLVWNYGNTGSFQSTGSVNTNQTWSYIITYLKVDAAGNTGSATRTVTVIGTIILSGSVSGTGSAVVSTGTIQPGTLIITNGNSITTTGSSGSSLSIPGSVNFLLSGSAWNGILYAPVLSTVSVLSLGDAGVVSNLPQDTSTTDYSYTVLPTLMAGGTGGTSIIASGWVFTLSMQVNSPSVSSGQNLPIFRSNDSSTWTLNTPTPNCILDSALMCTFTTDHLSFFGFVQVTSTPIIVTASTMIGPGGGGGSYIPSTIAINNTTIITSQNTQVNTTRINQRNNSGPVTNVSFQDDPLDTTDSESIESNTIDLDTIDIDTFDSDNESTMEEESESIIWKAYISVDNSLKVHTDASFGSPVIAYVNRNQEIEILDNDTTPNWSRIRFTEKNGTIREWYILSLYKRAETDIDQIRNGNISFADAINSMPEISWYINVAHSLNLRSGPSVYTRIKTVLRPNTSIIILDSIGKWREIMTEKYHGFVLSKYIRK